jgi:hypothetical protein
MNIKKSSQLPIDNLLKQTLKDDLPPEVENRLYIQLRQFQEKTVKQEKLQLNFFGFVRNFFNLKSQEWRLERHLIKSAALTFALVVFIILLAAAIVVPITSTPGVLAESFSTLTTSLYVSGQISQANAMECSVEAVTGKGERLNYSIRWTPDQTRVHILEPGKTIMKTLLVKNGDITIIDNINDTIRHGKDLEHMDDPQFQPIIHYLSPANFRERLQVKWGPRSYRQQGDCDVGTFAVLNPGEKVDTEVIVDMCTFLPTRMIKYRPIPNQPGQEGEIIMSIHFAWVTPSLPRLIDQKNPGGVDKNKKRRITNEKI